MRKVGRKTALRRDDVPTDHLAVSLRSYVILPSKKTPASLASSPIGKWRETPEARQRSSNWVLIFDCETRTTPDQSLRFGTYQLRHNGRLSERGIFYSSETVTASELEVLRDFVRRERPGDDGEVIRLRTRAKFVELVFYGRAYHVGAQIVGFNLPFDISRLAIKHVNARRAMKGGFSFTLIDDEKWPTVSVKHLSARSSWIRFTGTRPKGRGHDDSRDELFDEPRTTDRGYFVDVKTLSASLLSDSHTLDSLSKLLKISHPKLVADRHGETIAPDYVRYAMGDVQATWECFDILTKQLAALNLKDTNAYDLYSEASLGKAYLRTMGVKPWREMQPNFPPRRLGEVMSAYFGGRSEVHIRREIAEVIHCDFLSMYPTVCTLMGLWNFVTANGIRERADTEGVKQFVSRCTPDKLHSKTAWQKLAAIVQVLPQHDLFPVRARYGGDDQATIGLNYLTSDEPMWFTLADVLVSKVLTGKTPKILQAIRFDPDGKQPDLRSVTVAGRTIQPANDDFYKSLIMQRLEIADRIKSSPEEEKPRLESDRLAIKILANATSYGIFVELNVKDYDRDKDMTAFGARGTSAEIRSNKFEEPGRYFHPLLGTLITGAARFMLALAERQAIDQGLDWAFCDTDSLAIANISKLPLTEFKRKAIAVRDWFSNLNPYGRTESILQLEKVNFPKGGPSNISALQPPYCLTVSAKRYVLFNRDGDGAPIIRKASGHGLGHLSPPYDETPEQRGKRIKEIGVPLWQEDTWREIIRASDAGMPDQVQYSRLKNFDFAAASRYGATKPGLLQWFAGFNGANSDEKLYREQVKPFNFLLSLQAKSRPDMASSDMAALSDPLWYRREPRPAAPYSSDVEQASKSAFDRDKRELTRIPDSWLKSYARSLVRYHMHPEAKFWGGNYDERGTLRRRHVHALAFRQIGKEADNLDEREYIGDSDDDTIEYEFGRTDRHNLRQCILDAQKTLGISDREFCRVARVSHHTMAALRGGDAVPDATLIRLADTAEWTRRNRAG
jgi:hypothetical protein